ncbi:hypothetical protein FAIPA1_40107 [Frankia sp. AiPs1]
MVSSFYRTDRYAAVPHKNVSVTMFRMRTDMTPPAGRSVTHRYLWAAEAPVPRIVIGFQRRWCAGERPTGGGRNRQRRNEGG